MIVRLFTKVRPCRTPERQHMNVGAERPNDHDLVNVNGLAPNPYPYIVSDYYSLSFRLIFARSLNNA